MYIYKITNKINNKIYIGLTEQKNPKLRWYRHLSNSKLNVKGVLYNAIRKYGKENFDFDVFLYCFNSNTLVEMEKFFISYFNSTKRNIGYNVSAGGELLAEATKKKISET